MKPRIAPVTDYRRDRNRWEGLIREVHKAIAGEASPRDVADQGLAAERCWTMLAPFPRGLVCPTFARLVWAWGRQATPADRAALEPLLLASAGLVEVLFAETASTIWTSPDVAHFSPPSSDPAAPAARLPYVED